MGKINIDGLTTTGVVGVNVSALQTTASTLNNAYAVLPQGFHFIVPKTNWDYYWLADDGATQTQIGATSGGGLVWSDGTRGSLKNHTSGTDTTTYYTLTGQSDRVMVDGLTLTGVAGVNVDALATTPSIASGSTTVLPMGWNIVVPKTNWTITWLADDGTTWDAVGLIDAGGLMWSDGTRGGLTNATGSPDTTTYYHIRGLSNHINIDGLTTTGVAGINVSTVQTTASLGNGAFQILPSGFHIVILKTGWGNFWLAENGSTNTAVGATSAGGVMWSDGTRGKVGNVSAGASQTTTYYTLTGIG